VAKSTRSEAKELGMRMQKLNSRVFVLGEATLVTVAFLVTAPADAQQAESPRAWLHSTLPPEIRAALALDAMTLDEKISLVHGHVAFHFNGKPKPNNAIGSAGYVEGVPRLGIPKAMPAWALQTRMMCAPVTKRRHFPLVSQWLLPLILVLSSALERRSGPKRGQRGSTFYLPEVPTLRAIRVMAATSNMQAKIPC
jgi:hypothetical protein